MQHPSVLAPRERRHPLRVRVVTRPSLGDCWAVNLSQSGIGLVAISDSGGIESAGLEGSELELEFTLPQSESPVIATATVIWRHGGGGARVASLGLNFRFMSGASRAQLSEFLHAPPARVA